MPRIPESYLAFVLANVMPLYTSIPECSYENSPRVRYIFFFGRLLNMIVTMVRIILFQEIEMDV
jgi:hypothetical protein